MADRGQVHADLMRATRLELEVQQARARQRLGQLEVRHGRPLGAAADRHAAHVVAIAPDRRVDRAAARGRAAAHERDVLALDLPRAHLLPERRVGLVAAGEHEQAGGVAVEPVDHARALIVVTAAQAETAQRGHQRRPDHAGSRMRDHPGRLVGHDHVLVDERERDLEPDAGLGPGRSALDASSSSSISSPPARRSALCARSPSTRTAPRSIRRSAAAREGSPACSAQVAVEPRAGGLVLGDQLAAHGKPSTRSPGSPRTSAKISSPTPVTMKLSARLKLGSTCT